MLKSIFASFLLLIFLTQSSYADVQDYVLIDDSGCNTLFEFDDDDDGEFSNFSCYAHKNLNKDGRFYFPNIESKNVDLNKQTHLISQEDRIEKWNLTYRVKSRSLVGFDIKKVDGNCEIALSYINVKGSYISRNIPDYVLLDETGANLTMYTFQNSLDVAPCIISIKPIVVGLSELYQTTNDYSVSYYERDKIAVNNTYNKNRDFQNFLHENGYGKTIDISSARILYWDDLKLKKSEHLGYLDKKLTAHHVLSNICRPKLNESNNHQPSKTAYNHIKSEWQKSISNLEEDIATYQSLYAGGYYGILSNNSFAPSHDVFCHGSIRGNPLSLKNNMRFISFSYSFFDDAFYQNENKSHFRDYFEEIIIAIAVHVRQKFINDMNDDQLTILSRANRPISNLCSPIEKYTISGMKGAPKLFHYGIGGGCLESSSASSNISGYNSRDLYVEKSIQYANILEGTNISDTLLQAMENLGAKISGEVIVNDNSEPAYADVRTIGDRGRVLSNAPAWEASSIQSFIINDTKLIVITDTDIASGAGSSGPKALSSYRTSAENNYRADVEVFAQKLANEMVNIIEDAIETKSQKASD